MERYPPWSGERLPLDEAAVRGGRVAGRYLHGRDRDLLEDASGSHAVTVEGERPQHGDQVAGILEPRAGDLLLRDVIVLAPARRSPDPDLLRIARQRPALVARARIISALREKLAARGFLEVETPARVVNPGLEPHLRPFAATGSDGRERWLATSPELHLKRLLAAGHERFFELARCFRDEERGSLHLSEFLMLEWYRSHSSLEDLALDLAAMLPACAEAAGLPGLRVGSCDLAAAPEVVTFAEAFAAHADCDGHDLPSMERERIFNAMVEPHLGRERPTLLIDWPADASALARLRVDASGRRVAARAELFVAGVELANGFDELNDPAEQRRRHEADRAERRAAGAAVPPLDEAFLAALECGMPPSAGMALGVDRFIMLLLGASDIADVRLFGE